MEIVQPDSIPYPALADKLFPAGTDQRLIPFLGAGVSISARSDPSHAAPAVQYPSSATIDRVAQELGFTDVAKVFFTAATLLACHLESRQQEAGETAQQCLERLTNDPFPPSGADLSVLFSRYSNYTSLSEIVPRLLMAVNHEAPLSDHEVKNLLEALKIAASVTGIGWPPDPLSTMAAYFERKLSRPDLWEHLQAIFTVKTKVTPTHELLAQAAKWHREQQRATPAAKATQAIAKHYLVLTTNYDELMEHALDAAGVRWVSLANKLDTTDPQNPIFKTIARFSPGERQAELKAQHPVVACTNFVLSPEVGPCAIVYKLHGTLSQDLPFDDEGLVISDDDYVTFISQKETIPGNVKTLIQARPFLFLGYSLNDWNVRSIFESIRRQRAVKSRGGDFCVNRRVKTFEMLFFGKNDINVFQTDLNDFVAGVRTARGGPR